MSDIRKWFMKTHDKPNNAAAGNSSNKPKPPPAKPDPAKTVPAEGQASSGRKKTSKYFNTDKSKAKDEVETQVLPAKRKTNEDDGDDSVLPTNQKKVAGSTPTKKLKSGSGRGIPQKSVDLDESDEEDVKDAVTPIKSGGRGRGGRGASTPASGGRGRGGVRGTAQKSVAMEENDEDDEKDVASAAKSGGRGRGGRGASAQPSGGRGRGGGGRGGFMNFGERKDPPHKGEKEVPEGAPNCLAGLTFVISGTLDSLEREEAEDLIKRHGGRVTGSVSKKTNYLLCDDDIGGRKSEKAKELGTSFLTEDGLFDMIRASKPAKAPKQEECKKSVTKAVPVPSPSKVLPKAETKASLPSYSPSNQAKPKKAATAQSNLMWTEKHRPKNPKDIIGNQSLVAQLRTWLKGWHEQFSNTGGNKKGKKQNDPASKKAVLLSGTPGIGKTTSAKLVCQELGFQAIEVNASDSRGKADSKIEKGISGSNANSIKELVTNEALGRNMDRSKQSKTVLIMDEVDGMSAGDRGGVADLIASIKISKIPIICICNDRYSQKLKSLMNYCLLLSYRKPTKQQMAKKFMEVAKAEGLQVNEIALEELAERVNGDMRMALNQLQYMGLSMSVINYDDIRQRLLTNAKDEDISPFTAVDKLFGFNAGKMKMDERINLSMSDPDLVPLLIQENYINYRPSSAGKDDNGLKRMNLIARAAESIATGDIVSVQIRRYRQWQLSQTSSVASCILPASLLHGSREILEQGERNFNRFGGWLGKNSTMGKNMRLMDDLHVHILASRESSSGRDTIRLEYLTTLLKNLTEPLRVLPKAEAVEKVVEFMNTYSISQEDFDTIVELSKFKGRPNPLDGIQPAVKSALTKAYKELSKTRTVRAADLITLPGIKKAPKKRIAAILEPADEGVEQGDGGNTLDESEEENTSDVDESGAATGEKLKSELQSLNSKGVQVQLELKGSGSSKKVSGGRGKGASASAQKGAQTSKTPAKRKR
ncbi:replication factor C subunit 1 isoform X2 [Medicago truncatula]|uniref:replication factor C subunit 1 isoform X2 n=1 Tax=Medicago truncatula TaxID=3880 RepID=UPI000D2F2B18|nr:replication factor C subunit 1 isoform X2 [Medicago truncatula]